MDLVIAFLAFTGLYFFFATAIAMGQGDKKKAILFPIITTGCITLGAYLANG